MNICVRILVDFDFRDQLRGEGEEEEKVGYGALLFVVSFIIITFYHTVVTVLTIFNRLS